MRPRTPSPVALRDVPLESLAGACIEVWSPDAGDWREARRRYKRARQAWNAEHGVTDAAIGTAPWSYNWLLKQRGRQWLVAYLVRRGLPPNWLPAPAMER
jgi:hypothetical protein